VRNIAQPPASRIRRKTFMNLFDGDGCCLHAAEKVEAAFTGWKTPSRGGTSSRRPATR
jgi:hypothetical protein